MPPVGSGSIFTACRLLAGLSVGIAEAEVARLDRVGQVVAGLDSLVGASGLLVGSENDVTLNVIVWAVGSRSTPPLAVPPLSCTWKVKLPSGKPLLPGAGVKRNWPPVIVERRTVWPMARCRTVDRERAAVERQRRDLDRPARLFVGES